MDIGIGTDMVFEYSCPEESHMQAEFTETDVD